MKKIYFGCSIAGGRDHAHTYEDIVGYIKVVGAEVLSELFADKTLTAKVGATSGLTNAQVWQRDTDWVHQADGLIMEVTQPSLGVGYEIAKAENWNKPVLALFYEPSGRRLSPMIAGNPKVTVFRYSDIEETKSAIADFIAKL